MRDRYFAASNSSMGFCSYYENVFSTDKYSRIYVVKGGSGTGKSFFMKYVAKVAEQRGFHVIYIYCSSDAESLDGIIIDEIGIAVLDGTAPHVYEARVLGAVEIMVDLGQFLDVGMLKRSRGVIEGILNEKQSGFKRAYEYLDAYHSLSKNMEALIRPCIKYEKMKKFLSRFEESVESGCDREEHLLVRSIGMRGIFSFDTYYKRAEIYYGINDYFDTAHFMMGEIYRTFRDKKVDLTVSNDAIIPKRLNAIRVNKNGLTFEVANGGENDRVINMKRFVDTDKLTKIRQEYRAISRVRDSVLDLALAEFEKIKKYHFILEEIYGSAMNFTAKEEFTREFCDKIFENN